jgi:hypothetical protein
MARSNLKSYRRRRSTSALGVYGGFSLSSALVYCVGCLADSIAGERSATPRRSPGTVNSMNGDFMRVGAGR